MPHYNFKNPKIYVPTPSQGKQNPLISAAKFWKIMLFLGGAAFLIWFFFFSSFLKIRHIEVAGAADETIKSSFDQFLGKNILLLDTSKIQKHVQEKQPTAYKVEISRGLPDTLKIKIENKTPAVIWQTQDKSYFIAVDGFVLGETQDSASSNLIKVLDQKNIAIKTETQIVAPSFVDFVTKAIDQIKNETGLNPLAVNVGETTFQINVKTADFEIILDTTRDLDNQIKALKTVLDKHKNEITKYVDLRVNGRAYWQ